MPGEEQDGENKLVCVVGGGVGRKGGEGEEIARSKKA